MLWGLHGGGWMSGLIHGADDKHKAMIDLLVHNGLNLTSWSIKELKELPEPRLQQLAGWLREHNIRANLGVHMDFLADDDDEIKRNTEAAIGAIRTLAPLTRPPVCITGIPRNAHHYSRAYPLARQLDRLSKTMAPLAAECAKLGCPLSIHKVTHFGADLAELCSRVSGLGILLDTANCYLIGEPAIMAAEDCAPYTTGTHFKDHYVTPSFNPLGIRARGAVPGQGDCDLRQIYQILMKKAPNPQNLAMELEIDPVRDDAGNELDKRDVLKQALAFVRSL